MIILSALNQSLRAGNGPLGVVHGLPYQRYDKGQGTGYIVWVKVLSGVESKVNTPGHTVYAPRSIIPAISGHISRAFVPGENRRLGGWGWGRALIRAPPVNVPCSFLLRAQENHTELGNLKVSCQCCLAVKTILGWSASQTLPSWAASGWLHSATSRFPISQSQ